MSTSKDSSGSNVLFLSAEGCGPDDCLRQTVENPADENVLIITYTESVNDLLATLSDNPDTTPANLGIISAGEQLRSVGHSAEPVEMGGLTVSTIAQDDLTGLDIAVTEHLTMWAENGHATKVCFYSLTPLAMTGASPETLYRFLRVLTRQLSSADATGHFHVNPAAHSEEGLAKAKPLFDAVK